MPKYRVIFSTKCYTSVCPITLVNKDFVPSGKMSVSGVFLDAEFKYVSRISLHPNSSLGGSETSDEDVGQANNNMDCDPTFAGACSSNESQLLTQGDLNDFDRDLNLLKKQAELLGSRLKGSSAPEK